jgi:hypothetical protein
VVHGRPIIDPRHLGSGWLGFDFNKAFGRPVKIVNDAAMQRADKNIDELLEDLNGTFHRLRQSGIDEELFDVISGFEALSLEEK